MKKSQKIAAIICVVLILALLLGCGWYVSDYYPAGEAALAAMAGSKTVDVQQRESMVVFSPEEAATGFIFYPGGKVEATAYAPLMLALAEQNVLCILVEMPFRLAVLDIHAAAGIPEQFPEIKSWYIGGHSLGGSMAASFVSDHAGDFDGLVLLAAYSTVDLNPTIQKVLSLYGSEDGVLNLEKYEKYHSNLPGTTVETILEGGNHGGFGDYGHQKGDGQSTIFPEDQTRITANLLADFFDGLE